MYKSTLLQLVFIIVGLFTAVTGVQHLIQNFISLVVWSPQLAGESALMGFMVSCTYFIIAFFLVTRSKDWAEYISKLSRIHGDFSINAHPGQVIYFILIGLGFFSLLREVPSLIYRLYQGFAGKVERFSARLYRQDVTGEDWVLIILNVLFPLLIILFARPMADYFALRMNEDPIEIVEHQSTDL